MTLTTCYRHTYTYIQIKLNSIAVKKILQKIDKVK